MSYLIGHYFSFLKFLCYLFVIDSWLDFTVVREFNRMISSPLKFFETCYMAQHMVNFGKYSICPLKMCFLQLLAVVFYRHRLHQICSSQWVNLLYHYFFWFCHCQQLVIETGVKLSSYDCGFAYFSFLPCLFFSLHILKHIFLGEYKFRIVASSR